MSEELGRSAQGPSNDHTAQQQAERRPVPMCRTAAGLVTSHVGTPQQLHLPCPPAPPCRPGRRARLHRRAGAAGHRTGVRRGAVGAPAAALDVHGWTVSTDRLV